ncbi:MAG: UDP-N-acetylmuramoyl-L-alanine--D-glutamate ligase [Lachnospiraceae bacterium]|nr:UDP-N-acetylmuramoyl-L-alanine--D-glutamate ligase [Lachnospiraceae bacterium]
MSYLIVGMGKSGVAAAGLLQEKKQDMLLFNSSDMDANEFYKEHPQLVGIPFYTGQLPQEELEKVDIAVLSPGVPLDQPFVEELVKRGVELSGEVELAFAFGKGEVAAITGTNGKTTTTALTGEILKGYFEDVRVVGNIGIPYTSEAGSTTENTRIAAEISSFQLETIKTFHPKASAILNITPDHLNRHHTMENYIQAKEAITMNQDATDVTVLNYEDEVLRDFGKTLKTKVVYFSSARELSEGLYYDEAQKAIYLKEGGDTKKVIDVEDLNILGLHNYENVMAAVALALALGVPMDSIRESLKKFEAVEHRIEYVCEKSGVKFYNDSKGTNPDAAIKAVGAMNRPTCLIGGGYDKGSTYDEWIESFGDKIKKLVLIGVTKEAIAACCDQHGFKNYEFASSLEEAIDICYQNAQEGDAVLLSPACASWDMFPSYEVRGTQFKDYVRSLPEK